MRDTVRAPEMHDKGVQDDIACMVDDISSLRLLSEACEDDYPTWSDIAKSAIDASAVGTIDGELAMDRIHMYQTQQGGNSFESVDGDQLRPIWFGDEQGMIVSFLLLTHTDLHSLHQKPNKDLFRFDRAV